MYGLQYYLQINIFCMIILLLLYLLLIYRNRSGYTIVIYKKVLILCFLFCFVDIIAFVFRETNFLLSSFILKFFNSFYYILPILIGDYWNSLMEAKFTNKFFEHKFIKSICNFLPFVAIFLVILNLFTGILFVIDSNNIYVRGQYFGIYAAIQFAYLLYPIYQSLKIYFTSKNIAIKSQILPFCFYALAPLIAGVIQYVFYGVSCLQVGITIAALMIFLFYQEEEISMDKLTGINNRNSFNEYIQNKFNNTNSDQIISLMFMDINDFKLINDRYGHLVGDDILVKVAATIKKTCNDFDKNLFLARYGGDEFVLVSINSEDELIKLKNKINENVTNESKKYKYKVSLSIGYVTGLKKYFESVEQLIRLADDDMYKNKKKK